MADSGKNNAPPAPTGRYLGGENPAQNGHNGHGQRPAFHRNANDDVYRLWSSVQSWMGDRFRRVRSEVMRRTATTGPSRAEVGLAGGEDRPQRVDQGTQAGPNADREAAAPSEQHQQQPQQQAAGVTETDASIQHRRLSATTTKDSKISLKYLLSKTGLKRSKHKKGA